MEPMLDGLNAAQRTAVTSPADVLQILAPPGSGKTKTLTSRVAYLLQHHNYKPWNVICLTFTIKSSKEMKERISKLVDSGVEKKLVLGTFHSVCRRYLVAYGHLIGLKKDFGIADSSDQISVIKRIQKRLSLSIDPKIAQSRISNAKSKGLSYHDLAEGLRSKKDVEQQEVITLFEAYETHLTTSDLLDYDDLLLRCAYLLKTHPSCVSNVEIVLVDEFQDTNVVQFELLRLFAAHRNRITTVGDPDQSIYGWRSADVRNLKKMQRLYPDTLIIRLEDNYRSSGAILLAAQEVIEQDESRPQKSIMPTNCPGTMPVLRKLPSAAVEAEWIVTEIKRTMYLTGQLLEYADFAVLLRSAALSRLIESAMGKAGVPYRMVGGQRFYDRAEVKILLDYLRTVNQPHNNDALVRIINIPARGIGAATVKALREEAETQKDSLWTMIRNSLTGHKTMKTKISKTAGQGLSALVNIIMTTRAKLKDSYDPSSPEDLLRRIISKLDFQAYLEKSHAEDHEARWANVEELVAQASEYQISSPESTYEVEDDSLPNIDGVKQETGSAAEEQLSKFLANVALAAAVDVAKEDDSNGEQVQSLVTISTIHAAKGLEWPVVFIPSAYEGIIPHSRAEDNDEERRLLYVAMTRAQALLYLSCPMKSSQREDTGMSPFLSTKQVGRLLTNQGPKIKVPDIVDIARILRRDCPLEAEIEDGCRQLDSLFDDKWPLTGEESVAAIQKRWSKWDNHESAQHGQHISKKPRMANGTKDSTASCIVARSTTMMGSTITMNDPSTFSYQGNVGFSSAATQLQLAKEAESIVPPRGQTKQKMAGGAVDQEQRTKEGAILLSMWGVKRKADAKETASQLSHKISATEISGVDIHQKREDTNTRNPLASIPQDLATHRLNPIKKKPSPSDYVFLSSSPPETESAAQKPSHIAEDVTKEMTSLVKPAQTFHETTISQIQNSSALPRKTLGVRRNMSGWPGQPSRGFRTPVIAPR